MSVLRTLRIVLVIAAAAAVLAAAAASPWTPALGRSELRWAPVWLGLPILAAFAISEVFARTSRRAPAAVAATAAFGVHVGVALLHLALGAFMPESERKLDTWHLWPLFTVLQTVIFAGPLYLLAVVLWIIDRRRAERARKAA